MAAIGLFQAASGTVMRLTPSTTTGRTTSTTGAVEGAIDDRDPIHGKDALRAHLRDWLDTFDEFTWAPIEVERVDAGADKVLVHPRYEARGVGSGAEVELDYWLVATIRQGRILRVQWFVDRDKALKAAGLRE